MKDNVVKLTQRDVNVLKAWGGNQLGKAPMETASRPEKVSLGDLIARLSNSTDARGIAV